MINSVERSWLVTFEIYRQRRDGEGRFQSIQLQVSPDEYVLDAVERIWAQHDRTLTFRHACHHSTCGACAMRVNGVEKLTCITPIQEVVKRGGTIRLEPLHNFPILSDLVVDPAAFYLKLEETGFQQVASLEDAALPYESEEMGPQAGEYQRLVDCIECGMCVSACPAAATSTTYMGPAALAAAHQTYVQTGDPSILELVDSQDGVWRCHSAFECTEVCPSHVNPAWRIMSLRRAVMAYRARQFFRFGEKKREGEKP